jgi:hypothetical protein
MRNGLVVAFFVLTTLLAAVTLWRARLKFKRVHETGAASAYLAMMLIFCKSAGSLVFGVWGSAVICLIKPKTQVRLSTLLVAVALLYPLLRITHQFPDHLLVDVASQSDVERADSLKFRFDQEEILLDRTLERLFFGWGRYGRNRVYEENDGKDISVTDGHWIITISQFGLIGFLFEFGLLALPVFRAASALRLVATSRERTIFAGLIFIIALTVIEQLPNDSISPWSWLVMGSVLGRAEAIHSRRMRFAGSVFGLPRSRMASEALAKEGCQSALRLSS